MCTISSVFSTLSCCISHTASGAFEKENFSSFRIFILSVVLITSQFWNLKAQHGTLEVIQMNEANPLLKGESFNFNLNNGNPATSGLNYKFLWHSDSLYFGENVPENQPVEKEIIVKNTSLKTLFIEPTVSHNPTLFTLVSTGQTTLPPGTFTIVRLRFTGAPEGSYTGRLNLGPNLPANSFNIDLTANVVAGGILEGILQIVALPLTGPQMDGIVGSDWSSTDQVASGTADLKWYVRHSVDSLYIGRTGGDNNEPQFICLRAHYPNAPFLNLSFSYDNVSAEMTAVGGVNFAGYFKPGFDEFRTISSGDWGNGQNDLEPRYSVQGGVNHMEVGIPWYAITQGAGIPDSIRLVAFQTNGNQSQPFVYGTMPAGIAGGSINLVSASQGLGREILRSVTLQTPVDFGVVPIGSNRDTILIAYNRGQGSLTTSPVEQLLPPFSNPVTSEGEISGGKYLPFQVRFSPTQQGPVSDEANINWTASGNTNNLNLIFQGTGAFLNTPGIRLRSGNTLFAPDDTLGFGTLPYNSQVDTTVWVKNIGQSSLNFTLVNVSGFSYTQLGSSPTVLAPGDSMAVAIRLVVNGAGYLQGFLNIQSNAANHPAFLLNLSATGVVSNQEILGKTGKAVVFPNPGKTSLRVSGMPQGTDYLITNVFGQLVARGHWNGAEISIRELPPGSYHLLWGEEMKALRFVKE